MVVVLGVFHNSDILEILIIHFSNLETTAEVASDSGDDNDDGDDQGDGACLRVAVKVEEK